MSSRPGVPKIESILFPILKYFANDFSNSLIKMLTKLKERLNRIPLIHGEPSSAALLLMPVFITSVDVYFRAGYLAVMEPRGWTNYIISFFFELLFTFAVFKTLSLLRVKAKLLLPLPALLAAALLITVYGHYHYFGVLPNDYSLNYSIEHFDDTKTLIIESITPGYVLAYILVSALFLLLCSASLRAVRRAGKKATITAAVLFAAMLFFLNNNVRFNPASYSYSASTIFTVKYFLQKKYFGGDFQLERGYVKRQFTLPKREQRSLPFNIILVLSESVQRNNLQYYGYHRPTAPFIDSMARANQVIVFDRHFSNAVSTQFCMPILFSGIYAIDKVNTPYVYDFIKEWTDARTFFFSSQAMQKDNIDLVFNTSLDTFVCQENSGLSVFNDRGVDDFRLMENFMKFCRASKAKPFFAVFHLNNTHYPYKVSRAHNRKFLPAKPASLNAYDNSLVEQDELLRVLFSELRHEGLLENTMIVFTSDHGEAFNQHKHSGHLQTLYNEDTAVPFWLYVPAPAQRALADSLRQNSKINTSHLDFLPTILDAVGLFADSLLPSHLYGKPLTRKQKGRLVPLIGQDMIDTKGVVLGRYKYLLTNREGRTMHEIYDLSTDWSETRNLWGAIDPAIQRDLIAALKHAESVRGIFDK